MIEKINIDEFFYKQPNTETRFCDLCLRINELVDAVNKLQTPAKNVLTMVDNQVTADLPNIDVGELAFLSKENSDLKDEIDRLQVEFERTRKAFGIAVDAIDAGKTLADIAGFKTLAVGLEEALNKITALEQKD